MHFYICSCAIVKLMFYISCNISCVVGVLTSSNTCLFSVVDLPFFSHICWINYYNSCNSFGCAIFQTFSYWYKINSWWCCVYVLYVGIYFQVIRKSSDNVFNALLDILHERVSRDIKHEVSLCIGVLGYIISTESSRSFPFLWNMLT